MIILNLPVPPSVNQLYGNNKSGKGRGRYKTSAYRAWLRDADLYFAVQKKRIEPMRGPLNVEIRIPAGTRGDASNRIKAPEDYLVSRGITGDDRHNHKVTVERDASLDHCRITVTARGE
jgi:Holliday junction resolvase RusA-like endonuclease